MIRRLNIVESNLEPENKHVIWLHKGVLKQFKYNGWEPIDSTSNINTPDINFIVDGDGTKFLSDNGEYYTIETNNSYIMDFTIMTLAEGIGVLDKNMHDNLINAYYLGKRVFFKYAIGGEDPNMHEVKYEGIQDGDFIWTNVNYNTQIVYVFHISSNYEVFVSEKEL